MSPYTAAVLFARRDSTYKRFPDLDVYDADRDARTFRGGIPVICHPPCRGWGRLRWRSRHDDNELALGPFAIAQCRANRGVMEHPAASALWAEGGLPRPGQDADHYGGWTLAIDQSWWGHPSRKRTWLYIVGQPKVPPIPFRMATHRPVEELTRSDRERTPPELAEWLRDLVQSL